MSKPIEPGCMALIVGAVLQENIGKVVTVVGREGDVWRIEGDIVTVGGRRRSGLAKDKWLLRIDGDDHAATEEREDVEMPA